MAVSFPDSCQNTKGRYLFAKRHLETQLTFKSFLAQNTRSEVVEVK